MRNCRIGDIELRKSKSLKDIEYWEIVKWYPNPYYQKQDDYIEIEPNYFQHKEHPNWHIGGKTMFEHAQSCYTIYIVEKTTEEPDLRSVGRRPYFLDLMEQNDLHEVILYLYKNYDKQYEQDD